MKKTESSSKQEEKVEKEIARALTKRKNPHTEELVDHYWGSINYVFSLIKASEIKAGFIISFYGILLNIIYQNIEEVLTDSATDAFILSLFGIWIICTLISIYYSIRCFMPKIEEKYDKNIFFFGDIISKFGSIREFSQIFYDISLQETQLFDHLGQQVYILAKISAFKFKCVNLSIRFLAAGLLLLFTAGIYYSIQKFLIN